MTIPADAVDVLDSYDRLVATCRDLVPPETLDRAASAGRAARRRLGYLGSSLVVALVGGTGSGKSSLLNAIAAEEVAPVSPRRPTTDRPLAWVPSAAEPGLLALLEDLGIDDRVRHDRQPWLTIVDLPDLDSVVGRHRLRVDELLPRVDAVVWVLDPEKYHDARLHLDYLAPAVDEQHRFLFVLNQVDRIPGGGVEAVLGDLRASLRVAGFVEPAVLATAADPDLGAPEGVDALVEELVSRWEAKSLVWRNVVTRLDRVARELAAAAGIVGGTGFVARWEELMDRVVPLLVSASFEDGADDWWTATEGIGDLLTRIAAEVGGRVAEELTAIDVGSAVEESIEAAAIEVIAPKERRLAAIVGRVVSFWDRRRRRTVVADRRHSAEARLRAELDQRIGRRVREVLRRRGEGVAAFTEFELTLSRVEAGASPPPDRAPRT